ncbi:hypothetical protein [Xanthomonas phage JGB6]|nr:hypothetical protein [Xanthomonas phage JGB6]
MASVKTKQSFHKMLEELKDGSRHCSAVLDSMKITVSDLEDLDTSRSAQEFGARIVELQRSQTEAMLRLSEALVQQQEVSRSIMLAMCDVAGV